MTTLARIAEQIERRISGGDFQTTHPIDKREIILLIRQTTNFFIRQNLFENIKVGENSINGQYLSTFKNVEVKKDTDTDLTFSTLPAKYLELPHDKGLFQISPMKNQFDDVFIPIRAGAAGLFNNSPAGKLEKRIGFWPEGDRVYYKQDLLKKKIDKVLIKLVIDSPEDIDINDPYPIPPDLEIRIVEHVMGIMMQTGNIVQDKINDANATT